MRTISVYADGNQQCAVFNDFINLQESDAGFGNTKEEAIKELLRSKPLRCRTAMWWGWGGPAGHCGEAAYGPDKVMRYAPYYLSAEIAECPKHGGPTLEEAARDLAALSAASVDGDKGEGK